MFFQLLIRQKINSNKCFYSRRLAAFLMEKSMEYMIHACPARDWYVNDFLIPSMVAQGIDKNDIEVWMDKGGDGCLLSCLKSFKECGDREGGTWHLQDDVVIAKDFKEKTEKYDEGIVCGYMFEGFEDSRPQPGSVPALFMWNSFPCIRIPNDIAKEFVDWFFNDARYRENYKDWLNSNKHDDGFWHDFITEVHYDDRVINLKPSIVDHVDYLIGGSVVNKWRGYFTRATFWEDEESVNELEQKLAIR